MKLSLAKTFLTILTAGLILLALIAGGNRGLPEPLPTVRIFLGIIFVLWVPGYMLQLALFPHREDLDPLARAAFSFGLSIAVLPPIFLILSALGLGVNFIPIAAALTLFLLICAAVAVIRHRRFRENEELGINLPRKLKEWWATQDIVFRWLYILLALSLAVAVVSAFVVSQEKPGEHFTEFYILDSSGLSVDYPREVTAGTPIVIHLGITNREGEASQYNIDAVRGEKKALATAGPISLADGGIWEGTITFMLTQTGNSQEVDFLLERVGSPWPYRTLRIWMNVAESNEPAAFEPIGFSLRFGQAQTIAETFNCDRIPRSVPMGSLIVWRSVNRQ